MKLHLWSLPRFLVLLPSTNELTGPAGPLKVGLVGLILIRARMAVMFPLTLWCLTLL